MQIYEIYLYLYKFFKNKYIIRPDSCIKSVYSIFIADY